MKKQVINEIMGVPKAVDEWVHYISSVILYMVNDTIEEDRWDVEGITYKGKPYDRYVQEFDMDGHTVYKLMLSMIGQPLKRFLNSRTYLEYPLLYPDISIKVTVYPDEIFYNEGMDDGYSAAHSPGRVKNGNIEGDSFSFDITLPESYLENPDEDKLLDRTLPSVAHELTHSYQLYKQASGTDTSLFGQETVLNAATQSLAFKETPSWNDFLHLVYLHLSFELNARVTQLYYILQRSGTKDKDELIEILKKSRPWSDYQKLKSFDAQNFMNEFKADLSKEDPFFELMSRVLSPEDRPKRLPKDNDEWFQKLIDTWDTFLRQANVDMRRMGLKIPFMKSVPVEAKKNPLKFFKFFESRFHERADELMRRLTKVVSLVVNE